MPAIYWLRRDLRLEDNKTLHTALEHGVVIPVFIIDPHLITKANKRRLNFLFNGLQELDASLRARGSRLIVRAGDPKTVLSSILRESGAQAIYAEEDFTPYARRRDTEISKELPLSLVQGQLVHHPMAVLKGSGRPYTVFTPYSIYWKSLLPTTPAPLPAPERLPSPPPDIPSSVLPTTPEDARFLAGEVEARRRLKAFTQEPHPSLGVRVHFYEENRNRLALEGTSTLSPYIHFGMLGLPEAVRQARLAIGLAGNAPHQKGAETWLNELIWREFYIHILYHFPNVRRQSFRTQYDQIRWDNDLAAFEAWKNGETGYPVVDAAMRQLHVTGWMHNRARMIVASFLVKDLLIDWRWGERWFMQQLVDGDIAANNGGWQWVAGTGTDAAPYFRIFNPTLQGKKFDPRGNFIREWLPELRQVPLKYIHMPWKMPSEEQRNAGCEIGKDYPAPIIDHSYARQRTVQAYKLSRDISGA
ncbi:cryptochrome/photolyase family protein [Chloroflexota bacterium]